MDLLTSSKLTNLIRHSHYYKGVVVDKVNWLELDSDEKQYIFTTWATELAARVLHPVSWTNAKGFDVQVGHETPDLMEYDAKTHLPTGRYIEFKGTFTQWTHEKQERVLSVLKDKYNFLYIIEWITYDTQFPRKYHLTHEECDFYLAARAEVWSFMDTETHQGDTLGSREASKILNDSLPNVSPLPNLRQDKDVMLDELMRNLSPLERFVNDQAVSAAQIAGFITETDTPTIFVDSPCPFDRDTNRRLYDIHYPNDPTHSHGYKANFIQVVPPDSGFPITQEDLNLLAMLSITTGHDMGNLWNYLKWYLSDSGQQTCSKMHVFNQDIAFLSGTTKGTTLDDYSIRYKCHGSQKELLSVIKSERALLVNQVSSSEHFHLGKHGLPQLKDTGWAKVGMKRNNVLGSSYPSKLPTKCELGDYFASYDPMESMIATPYLVSDCKGAYAFDTHLNQLSDEIATTAANHITTILSSKIGTTVRRIASFYRALIAACPKITKKGMRGDEVIVVRVPGENWIAIATPTPNNITTGMIQFIYKGTASLPKDLSDGVELQQYGYHYWITKPFRLPLAIVAHVDEYVGSFLGYHSLMLSKGVNLLTNPLLASLFLRPSMELLNVYDVNYLFLKTMFQKITLGKNGLAGRISCVSRNDIRSATILYRLKHMMNQPDMKITGEGIFSYNMDKISDYKSPLFDYKYPDEQACQADIYLKVLGEKSFSRDPVSLMAGFFEGEAEHQDAFTSSQFGEKLLKEYNDSPHRMSGKDFIERMLTTDENNKLWQLIVYYPDLYYCLARDTIKDSIAIHTPIPYAGLAKSFLKSATASKTLAPSNTQQWTHGKTHDKGDLATKYPDLCSMPQTEAFILADQSYKEAAKQGDVEVQKVFAHRQIPIWNSDEPITMLEAATTEQLVYKGLCILAMVLKEQKGASKRAFFVQGYWSMTGFRLLESVVGSLLSGIDEDLMHVPGNDKYIHFQDILSSFQQGFAVTQDQKKFGDTYAIRVFELTIQAMVDEKVIDQYLGDVCMRVVQTLYNRIELMPAEVQEQYLKFLKTPTDTQTDAQRKHTEFYAKLAPKFLGDHKRILSETGWTDHLASYPSITKRTGFILGVLNNCGSFATSTGAHEMRKFLRNICPMIKVESVKQSDDGEEFCNGPFPGWDMWSGEHSLMASRYCTVALNRDRSQGDNGFSIANGVIRIHKKLCPNPKCEEPNCPFYHIDHNPKRCTLSMTCLHFGECRYHKFHGDANEYEDFPVETPSKVVCLMGLLFARIVGCCPSLDKWGFGSHAEMLQVIVSMKGDVWVPLIRHCCALGAEMPGVSFGGDMITASLKCYDVVLNKGHTELVGTLQQAAIELVRMRYGMPDVYIDRLPNAFGKWWSLAPDVARMGLVSNEIRVRYLAEKQSMDGDPRSLNRFINMFNVGSSWEVSQAVNDEIVNAVVGDNEEWVQKVSTSFKDILIIYNRERKTNLSAKKLADATAGFYQSFSKRIGVSCDETEFHKRYKYILEFGIYSTGVSIINQKHKFLSESYKMQHNKVDEGSMLIQRLGYKGRLIAYPDIVKTKDNKMVIGTISHLWDILGDITPTSENMAVFNIYKAGTISLYNIFSGDHCKATDSLEIGSQLSKSLYRRVSYKEAQAAPADVKLAVALAIDIMKDPEWQSSVVCRVVPFGTITPHIVDLAQEIARTLYKMVPSRVWAIDNYRMICSIFLPYAKSSVITAFGVAPTWREYLTLGWTHSKSYLVDQAESHTQLPMVQKPINYRPIVLAFATQQLLPTGPVVINDVPSDRWDLLALLGKPFTHSKFNQFLASVHINNNVGFEIVTPLKCRRNPPVVLVKLGTVKILLSRIIQAEENPPYKIEIVSQGALFAYETIVGCAMMVSYFIHYKKQRFRSIEQLHTAVDEFPSSCRLIGDKLEPISTLPKAPMFVAIYDCESIKMEGTTWLRTHNGFSIYTTPTMWDITPWDIPSVCTGSTISIGSFQFLDSPAQTKDVLLESKIVGPGHLWEIENLPTHMALSTVTKQDLATCFLSGVGIRSPLPVDTELNRLLTILYCECLIGCSFDTLADWYVLTRPIAPDDDIKSDSYKGFRTWFVSNTFTDTSNPNVPITMVWERLFGVYGNHELTDDIIAVHREVVGKLWGHEWAEVPYGKTFPKQVVRDTENIKLSSNVWRSLLEIFTDATDYCNALKMINSDSRQKSNTQGIPTIGDLLLRYASINKVLLNMLRLRPNPKCPIDPNKLMKTISVFP